MSHQNDKKDNSAPAGTNKNPDGGDHRRELPKLPKPPDIARVHRLRKQVKVDRASGQTGWGRGLSKFDPGTGKRIRDAGFYTLIPMVMAAGPLFGYFIGHLLEKKIGGEPWPVTICTLVGLAAGFYQVFLMLTAKTDSKDGKDC